MSKIKLGTYVTAPRGKIITGRYNEHKGDTGVVRDLPKSKHVLNLRSEAKSKAIHTKMG